MKNRAESEDALHPRQIEILRIIREQGGKILRPQLQRLISFMYSDGVKKGCGSPLGRYIGFPSAESEISKYPKSLLNRGYVTATWRYDFDSPKQSQVVQFTLTAKAIKFLDRNS